MKRNLICFVEIPVLDLDRAVPFFEKLFDVQLNRLEVDGNHMAMFPDDMDAPGVSPALVHAKGYAPSDTGCRVYFGVEDIDATLAKVHSLGGTTNYPKTCIGEYGWVAEFRDLEGNILGLHSPPTDMPA
ncbi:VOC family protein [Tuwongella immobilis]|uniref:VOC domain-containing protein n=1 Tax=Tuwongella immobilis TaxID=692036 RepID=A0A6C2YJA2_9BACT|nr:VOC family protein [Tuwongella immobilis]VIP01486.1 Uncharacterized protein OS=Vibrio nigripulchritudo ATCC 27043 GN=VINI7043_12496 PE=4 SV=1: Glyoxalase_2 [Tuwongella immobilis]VTR98550.1 Uncharacterized protein OS=Vibrio nigripulchritudo ATCC 27043 GN=VINI7043_12496 PE=4 SV=1: Glyoxalase_2 [Tuwongella immobilis]